MVRCVSSPQLARTYTKQTRLNAAQAWTAWVVLLLASGCTESSDDSQPANTTAPPELPVAETEADVVPPAETPVVDPAVTQAAFMPPADYRSPMEDVLAPCLPRQSPDVDPQRAVETPPEDAAASWIGDVLPAAPDESTVSAPPELRTNLEAGIAKFSQLRMQEQNRANVSVYLTNQETEVLRRLFVLSYLEHGQRNEKWDAVIDRMLSTAFLPASEAGMPDVEIAMQVFSQLRGDGCADPLLIFAGGMLAARSSTDRLRSISDDLVFDAVKFLPQSTYSPLLQGLARAYFAEALRSQPELAGGTDAPRELALALDEIAAGLAEQPHDSATRRTLLKLLYDGPKSGIRLFRNRLALRIAAETNVDPWLRCELLARAYEATAASFIQEREAPDLTDPAAIVAQGGIWGADPVIGPCLKYAAQLHAAAYLIDNLCPEPCIALIRLRVQVGPVAGEGPRFWFERATCANFDSEAALAALCEAGVDLDADALWALAVECRDTPAYDTPVPTWFFPIVETIEQRGGLARFTLDRDPEHYADFQRAMEVMVYRSSSDAERSYWLSRTVAHAVLHGDPTDIQRRLGEAGAVVDPRPFEEYGLSLTDVQPQGATMVAGAAENPPAAVPVVAETPAVAASSPAYTGDLPPCLPEQTPSSDPQWKVDFAGAVPGRAWVGDLGPSVPSEEESRASPELLAALQKLIEENPTLPMSAQRRVTGAQLAAADRAVRTRLFVQAYRDHGHRDPQWDELVEQALQAAFVDEPVRETPEVDTALQQARSARELGCRDPLMHYALAFLSDYTKLSEFQTRSQLEYSYSVRGFSEFAYSPLLRGLARAAQAASLRYSPGQADPQHDGPAEVELALNEIAAGLAGEPTDSATRRVLLRLLYSDRELRGVINFHNRLALRIAADPAVDPWFRCTMLGLAYQATAKAIIGQGAKPEPPADEEAAPTEDHGAFGNHPQVGPAARRAQALLTLAAVLDPDCPAPAVALIKARYEVGPLAGEGPRFWFERAIHAQFDSEEALAALYWVNDDLDRFELYRLAVECLETEAVDTAVPGWFFLLVEAIGQRQFQSQFALYRDRERYKDFQRAFLLQLSAHPDEQSQRQWKSRAAANAFACGDEETSARLILELGSQIDPTPYEDYGVSLEEALQSMQELTGQPRPRTAGNSALVQDAELPSPTEEEQEPDVELRDYVVARYRQQPRTTIGSAPDGYLEAERLAAYAEFARQDWVETFRQTVKADESWSAAVEEVLEGAYVAAKPLPPQRRLEMLKAANGELIDQQWLFFLLADSQRQVPNTRVNDLINLVGATLHRVDERFGPHFRWRVRALAAETYHLYDPRGERIKDAPQLYDAVLADLVEWTSRKELRPHERQYLLREITAALPERLHPIRLRTVLHLSHTPGVDPWLADMLLANEHFRLGWEARGTGFINTVTPEGLALFHAHLRRARTLYLRAWRTHPELPEAPSRLVEVVMAVGGMAEDDTRFWFDQAVRAQFDYLPAYTVYEFSLRPRWGGSLEAMAQFGLECLATKRYDTRVPLQFFAAELHVGDEAGGIDRVFRLKGLEEPFREFFQEWGDQQTDPLERDFWHAHLAVLAYYRDRKDEVLSLLEGLDDHPASEAFRNCGLDLDEVREELDKPGKEPANDEEGEARHTPQERLDDGRLALVRVALAPASFENMRSPDALPVLQRQSQIVLVQRPPRVAGEFPAETRPKEAVALVEEDPSDEDSAAEEPPQWNYSPDLLRPFWEGTRMEGESVLFIRDAESGEARASVLFPIEAVIAVQSSAGDVTYEEGRDYRWEQGSREIVLPVGSRVVSVTEAELRRPANSQRYQLTHRDGNGEIFFGGELEYHALQTSITYEHAPDLWDVPTPVYAAQALPRTTDKLLHKRPLTIVVIGDSISTGCNASGWGGGPPYQPAYPDLLRLHLENRFQTKVTLHNLSVGGKDTAWLLTMLDDVAQLQPDLVIIAFGMNDSGGRPAEEFRDNTAQALVGLRERLPEAEFILVATMLGNPAWTRLDQALFPAYRDALAALCAEGVALADVTSVWTEFFEHKQDWDLTGNGVNHPNDFGHRVYAQVISALLIPSGHPDSQAGPGERVTAGALVFDERRLLGGYSYSYACAAADLDGDGDLDLTSADAEPNNNLYLLRGDGAGGFQQSFIQKYSSQSDQPCRLERHAIGDLNGDGLLDVVIVDNLKWDIRWFENPGAAALDRPWPLHRICTAGEVPGAYDVTLADFDSDGDVDVAASSWRFGNRFDWFENPGITGVASPWQRREIAAGLGETRTIVAADFNRDGRPDLLGTARTSHQVLWYENPAQPSVDPWTPHPIDEATQFPAHGHPVDLDGDGDLDVVLAFGIAGGQPSDVPDSHQVAWYENVGQPGLGTEWVKHAIATDFPQGFEAVAGDLDGDADLDVVATGWGPNGRLTWFENSGDPRESWTAHPLKEHWPNAVTVILADLDSDGRLDIAACAERGANELRWWRNLGAVAVEPQ